MIQTIYTDQGVYTWSENDDTIHLEVPLKGTNPRSVSLYGIDLYLI